MNKTFLVLDLKKVSFRQRETIFIIPNPTATSIRPGCQLYSYF